jgi:hypothetical protein
MTCQVADGKRLDQKRQRSINSGRKHAAVGPCSGDGELRLKPNQFRIGGAPELEGCSSFMEAPVQNKCSQYESSWPYCC